MELPRKLSEQIVFITRPKTDEHMFIDMDKATDGEKLSEQLKTYNKQFKIALTFMTGYKWHLRCYKQN